MQFARDAWQVIGLFSGALLLICLYVLIAEPSPFLRGLIIGVAATAFAAAFVIVFLIVTGSALTLAGAWAEDVVNDEVKKARKRSRVWGHVPNIEIGGFDLDHVVVAPGGVLCIETKAHVTALDHSRASANVLQAKVAAQKLRSVLRSRDVGAPYEVIPVLAVWGRRATRSIPDEGRVVDGVHVVTVIGLADWLDRFRTGRIAEDHAEHLLAQLRAFRDAQSIRRPVLK
jgi:hypothetical protein